MACTPRLRMSSNLASWTGLQSGRSSTRFAAVCRNMRPKEMRLTPSWYRQIELPVRFGAGRCSLRAGTHYRDDLSSVPSGREAVEFLATDDAGLRLSTPVSINATVRISGVWGGLTQEVHSWQQ